ncbi:MAG TPA: hypothetical protein VIW24_29440 [Aldersonia sp.]
MKSPVEVQRDQEFGAYSDDLTVDINGSQEHITIYHRVIDDVWSEYTAVTDDGMIVSRNKSLRRLLLEDEEVVSP